MSPFTTSGKPGYLLLVRSTTTDFETAMTAPTSAKSLKTQVVTQREQLHAYLPQWRALSPSPMQSPEWMLSWWDCYRNENSELRTALFTTDENRLVGVAPFYKRSGWSLGNSMRFLGSGTACTDLQTIISAKGYQEPVASATADWLVREQRESKWSICEFDGVSLGDSAMEQLQSELQSRGYLHQSNNSVSTWRVPLKDGWTGFLQRLSKTQRRQSRNLINRYDKNDAFRLRITDSEDSLPDALATLRRLHQLRWEAAGESGCFADPRFIEFVSCLQESMVGSQSIKVATLADGSEPIACLLMLQDQQGLYVYQSGRDPAREKEKIGVILNLAMIRWATENEISFGDYLRGDEIYKSRLGAVGTPCLRVRYIAPDRTSRLRYSAFQAGRGVRKLWQSATEKVGL